MWRFARRLGRTTSVQTFQDIFYKLQLDPLEDGICTHEAFVAVVLDPPLRVFEPWSGQELL